MLVCGIDIETTGLVADKDTILEIGLALWDVDSKKLHVCESMLITSDIKYSEESEKVHGITDDMIMYSGLRLEDAILKLRWYCDNSEYFVAHNGNAFDRLFLDKWFLKEADLSLAEKPWIDTMTDIPYPKHIKTRKLDYLAMEHGFINPFPHRALFDTMTMLRILSQYNIEEVLVLTKSPMIRVVALVSFDDKDKAKTAGYKWDAEKKQWYRNIKEVLFKNELEFTKSLGFDITVDV
jgi:DNA polymerase III subunit epsilon